MLLHSTRRCIRHALTATVLAAILTAMGCGRDPGNAPHAVDDSTRVVRQRIVALEAARSFGDGFLPSACRHSDPRVRRAAAVALGRIQSPTAIPALLPLLADPDTTVMEQAVFALGQLRGLDEAQHHTVQGELVTAVRLVPMRMAPVFLEALGRQGGAEVCNVLAEFAATGILATQGSEGRPAAIEGAATLALGRIGGEAAKRHLAQLGDLRNREGAAAWRIASGMALAPDPSSRTTLLSGLEHPDAWARAAAARALGKSAEGSVIPELLRRSADNDARVRASVLLAVAELAAKSGGARAEARSFAAALAGDLDPLVREAALVAVESLGVGPHRNLIEPVLRDPVPAVRLGAMRVLARAEGVAARPAWDAARRDSVEFVRAEALGAAAFVLGTNAAVQVWTEALARGSVRERTAAAAALGAAAPPRGPARAALATALAAALDDADFAVAATAAEAIGKLGLTECAPSLATAYAARTRSRSDADVRQCTVEAAGAMLLLAGRAGRAGRPDAALTALCLRAAADPDPRIAHAAHVGLARARGAPEPDPAPPAVTHATPDSLPPIDLGPVQVRLVTRHGDAILELDGDRFPRTVTSFLRCVDSGVHQDGVFHRVVPAFVVQGGDPRGDGWGDAGWSLPCEYGDLRYDAPGVVGMAHAGKDTGGSQFFITHLPVPRLDGRYTAFGRVVRGMEIVDRIVRGDRYRIERIADAHQ